ncbi:MAG: hypothetical protein E2581_24490 [Pseudomonas sp.]|uniref:hypothetical protein n=1 Tax=Pseudomonas sp. TaxID=306 RepID=UPI001E02CD3E|nr:hypothetical protein [Pseudomonas sp.]MPT01621.1 hypothetical protein [Pseudomonas sp.]
MTERAEITLEIGGEDFDFVMDTALVTKLKPLLSHPSTTLEIAGALVEEFSPKVEVIVKKRSSTLTA